MIEADRILPQSTTPARAHAMSRAVTVLARQRAIKRAKRQLHAKGMKPQYMARKEIVAVAEEYLNKHRDELITGAKETVLRWYSEGMFGKRGGIRNPVRRAA